MGSLSLLLTIALGISLAINAIFIFRHVWREPSTLRTMFLNVATVTFTTFIIFMAAEIYCRTAFTASGAFAFTKASKAWFRAYWHPVNSLGYRDDEYTAANLATRRTILVLGDSIAAGHGIEDYRLRFGNRLQQRLGERWQVATVAQCGWNTSDEIEALRAFPATPDLVVLSYCVNDLDAAARKEGLPRPPVPPPGRIAGAIIERFHFADFVYWQFVRGPEVTATMWQYYDACYTNERVWERHRKELASLIELTRDQGAPLVVVVFPLLTDVARTAAHNERVIAYVEAQDVAVIDMTETVASAAPGTFVVNRFDGHPNAALHAIVAEQLEHVVRTRVPDAS